MLAADATSSTTTVGISHPRAGSWTVAEAPGSPPIGERGLRDRADAAPKVSAKVQGKGFDRTLSYKASVPGNITATFAEKERGASARDRQGEGEGRHDPVPSAGRHPQKGYA